MSAAIATLKDRHASLAGSLEKNRERLGAIIPIGTGLTPSRAIAVVLDAAGPDPMPVVRAAMAWRENRGSTAPMNKLAEAVDAYRKAGGK